jgi:hypothetical protein
MTPKDTRCPKCASSENVRSKLLLIDEFNHAHFMHSPDVRSACDCHGQLSVDGLRPEFVQEQKLQQFVSGLYCDACGIGFVPDEMAKPSPQRWISTPEGHRRVNPDGSLGPPQQKIS